METQESQSHYIAIKYYDKWYLYDRCDSNKSHKDALNSALYNAADTFKHVYNSSAPTLKIKSDLAKNSNKTFYQTFGEYFNATKDIPLSMKFYI